MESFYPPGMQRRKQHALEFLGRQCFDVVEINTFVSTGHIKPELVKSVGPRQGGGQSRVLFFHRQNCTGRFTHSPLAVMEPTSAAKPSSPAMKTSGLAARGVGCVGFDWKAGRRLLIQFPVSFKNTLLKPRVPGSRSSVSSSNSPRVVEVRHDTWNRPDTISYFTEKKLSPSVISTSR